MANLFANSGDPDQMPHPVAALFASYLFKDPDYNGLMRLNFIYRCWQRTDQTDMAGC